MDYNYIKQLLERYFECETTLEEEKILRTFFSQKDVPASLLMYRDLFIYEEQSLADDHLDEDFENRLMEKLGIVAPVKAKKIKFYQRLAPLYKAAALVAIILTIGNAIDMSMAPEGSISPSQDYFHHGEGMSEIQNDSAVVDSMQRSSINAF